MPRDVSHSDSKCWNGGHEWVKNRSLFNPPPLPQMTPAPYPSRRVASMEDVAGSIKAQLMTLVDWAKAIPPFANLIMEDKVIISAFISA